METSQSVAFRFIRAKAEPTFPCTKLPSNCAQITSHCLLVKGHPDFGWNGLVIYYFMYSRIICYVHGLLSSKDGGFMKHVL